MAVPKSSSPLTLMLLAFILLALVVVDLMVVIVPCVDVRLIADRLLVLTSFALMVEAFNTVVELIVGTVRFVMEALVMLALVIPAFAATNPLGPITVKFLILASVRTSNSDRVVVSATLRSLVLIAEKIPVVACMVVSTAETLSQ